MVRQRQAGCSGIITGVVFFVIGALFLVIFGQTTRLTCRRLEARFITCQKDADLFGLIRTQRRTLDGVQQAWVEESCDSDGCTYRVVLETGEGSVPFTTAYSSGYQAKERLAQNVNAFVAGGEPGLDLTERPALFLLLLPLIFMAVGPLIVLQSFLGVLSWIPAFLRLRGSIGRGL